MTDPGALRIGVLLSGSGRTLMNLLERIAAGRLSARINCVIADRDSALGLERARQSSIPAFVERDTEGIYRILDQHQVELVLLCGYLRLLPIRPDHVGRIWNIHPSLLPKYGGKGFHGDHVHAAVLAAGDQESGCTVHVCDEVYDRGRILLQKRVPVLPGDDVRSLAARVFAAECEAYPEAIERFGRAASQQQMQSGT